MFVMWRAGLQWTHLMDTQCSHLVLTRLYTWVPGALVLVMLVTSTEERHFSLWQRCYKCSHSVVLEAAWAPLKGNISIMTVNFVSWKGNETLICPAILPVRLWVTHFILIEVKSCLVWECFIVSWLWRQPPLIFPSHHFSTLFTVEISPLISNVLQDSIMQSVPTASFFKQGLVPFSGNQGYSLFFTLLCTSRFHYTSGKWSYSRWKALEM